MSWHRFSKLAIVVVAMLLLLPFVSVKVWDGSFPLTIVIDTDQPIDPNELYFATCWHKIDAEYAIETGTTGDAPFGPGDSDGDNLYTISVPCSGRAGPYGIEYSYHQPLFLILEYSMLQGDNKVTRRKRFNIPTGRGPQSINVVVP